MGFNRSYLRSEPWSDPTWLPGSYVIFSTDSADRDDTVATEYVQESMRRQITWGEVEEWQAAHPKSDQAALSAWLESRLSKKVTIASKHAYLAAKIDEWGGLDNTVQEDYQDDTKPSIGTDEKGRKIYPLHDDAGKLAPITPFWVSMHDPTVVDRMWDALREEQKGRSAEEQARFRLRLEGMDEPGRDNEGAEETPAAAGA